MELMNQPFTGQLGNRLIELLDSQDYHTLNIIVAFAKNSGVLRIKDSIKKFRKRGGVVNIYVGIDLGVTSYEALTTLFLHTNSLNIVHSEKNQTFHTKIYQFIGESKGFIIVGSHNLTGGGLWTNFESSIHTPVDRSNIKKLGLDDYLETLSSLENSFLSITTQCDIDKLLQHGYIFKEVAEQVRIAKIAIQKPTQKRLFGNGVPTKLPGFITPKKEQTAEASAALPSPTTVPSSGIGQTIWFETKSMTGGSRNILDLSMKSLVERGTPQGTPFDIGDPKFMRGGVEFFGLDPKATDQFKNITLNFEGVDYAENKILFPDGVNNNGTWRLQIKGVSASQTKITDAFRDKGEEHYLVGKIITFTKVENNYFFMSVLPTSELESFKSASYILARNGSTKSAKQLGLILATT